MIQPLFILRLGHKFVKTNNRRQEKSFLYFLNFNTTHKTEARQRARDLFYFFFVFSFFPEFLFITQVGTKLWKRKENLTRFKKLILTQFKKPHTYIFPTYLLSREFLAHFNFFHKNRELGQFENNFYSTTSRNF